MKKNKFKFLTVVPMLLAIGFTSVAKAEGDTVVNDNSSTTVNNGNEQRRTSSGGFYLEPILFAQQQDSEVRTSNVAISGNSSSGQDKAYGLGVRLGGHVGEILFLGADARYARIDMNDSFYGNTSGSLYNYGPMIGAQTPLWGIRVMTTYVAGGELSPNTGPQGLNVKYNDPRGWRYGGGVHVGSVGINLEYEDLTYNTTHIQSFGSIPINTAANVTTENKGYTLSLSFPMAL